MIRFKEFLNEVAKTKRIGLEHLEKMKPIDFIKLLKVLEKDLGGILKTSNAKISEKVDGAGIRFGVASDGKFFIESSKSGPVFSGKTFTDFAMAKDGKVTETALGYANIFDTLSTKDYLKNWLRSRFPGGVKVIGEFFYNAFASTEGDGITFVGTRYDKKKLGTWGSFVLFGFINPDTSQPYPDEDGTLEKEFKKLSTDDFKLLTPELSFTDIDISVEIKSFNTLLANYKDVETLLQSRKKVDRDDKLVLQTLIAKEQENIANKIITGIGSGKFGLTSDDFEGVVISILGDRDIKITSPKFKAYMKQKLHDIATKRLASKDAELYKLPTAMIIGKMSPPTKAHEQIIKNAIKKHQKVYLFLTGEKSKNKAHILTFNQKKNFIKAIEPSSNLVVLSADSGMIAKLINNNIAEKEDGILIYTGTDRLKTYAQQAGRIGRYTIGVAEIPRTNEDISATKARDAISNDDYKTYKKMIASKLESKKWFEQFKREMGK